MKQAELALKLAKKRECLNGCVNCSLKMCNYLSVVNTSTRSVIG